MIYTVTLNPAIDYVVGLDAFVSGAVNRCNRENIEFGGKGINVSRVLHQLGVETTALGFIAGFTGQALEQGLQEMGLRTRFIPVSEGMTRINVKIHAGQETEINGIGPQILPCELQQLMTQLGTIEAGDTVVFSGSIPKCLASDTYGKLMDCLPPQVRTVVDTTGEALRCALSRKPYLVKPNLPELEDFFGIPMDTKEKVEFAARKMQEMGAKNVLVSMAAQGAMLLDEYGCTHWAKAPKGEVVNSVGAGDSMVAGFLAAVTEGKNAEFALRMGIAAGSATAFQSGLAEKEKIMELLMEM
jgi:1-phosphofructokinase